MVDSISGNGNNIQDSALIGGLGQQQAAQNVQQVNVDSADNSSGAGTLQLLDQANISDAAKAAYEGEKEVLRFSRLAQRVKEPFDSDKVAQMKNMVDSGKLNDYLRGLNTDSIAQSMLGSPSGAFLSS